MTFLYSSLKFLSGLSFYKFCLPAIKLSLISFFSISTPGHNKIFQLQRGKSSSVLPYYFVMQWKTPPPFQEFHRLHIRLIKISRLLIGLHFPTFSLIWSFWNKNHNFSSVKSKALSLLLCPSPFNVIRPPQYTSRTAV